MNLTTLACPKCRAEMRTYERSGIHVDQCAECRGIFLDRGELERLMDAEAAHYAREQRAALQPAPGPVPLPVAMPPAPVRSEEPSRDGGRPDSRRGDWDDDDRRDDRGQPRGVGRRRGFLGDMFEMLGE
jgi:hypothetical protein